MNTGIYIIKNNISDKVYIGSAVNIKKRLAKHFSALKHNEHHSIIFQRFYNKYKDSIILKYEVLEYCEINELIQKEQFYIDNCENMLLNVNKIANSRLGLTNRPEHNQKISDSLIGHTLSEETRMKISNTLSGVKLPQERIEKKYVKVNQYDEQGKLVKTWNSIKEAFETLNIARSRIALCLKYPHISYKDNFWRYFEEDEIFKFYSAPIGSSRKIALIENEIIIKEFNTIKEAANELNLNSSRICDVCSGKRKSTGGLKFKYL